MSGSANNLPIKVTLDGVDDVNRQIRALADSFTAPTRAAEQLPAAVGKASEAFNALEGRAQAGRRALNDLGGALELIGGSGAGGSIGAVASYVGNIADLFGTAGLAAGRFEGAAGVLSSRLTAMAGIAALPIFLQSVGLGINDAGTAAESATGTTDGWRATLERLNPVLAENARLAGEAAEATKRLRDQQAGLEEGFGRVLERRAAIVDQIGPGGALTRQIAAAEGALGAASDAVAREGARPLSAERRQFLQDRLQEAENNLRALQARSADLNAELARLSSNAGPTAPGEPGSPNYEFSVIGNRLGNTDPRPGGPQFGPDAPATERGGRGGGGAGEDFEAGFERAERLARRAVEQTNRAADRQKNLGREVERTNDTVRELGLTFNSAFEDAITGAKSFQDILNGLEQDLLRLGTRKLGTEPLLNFVSGLFGAGSGATGGSFDAMKFGTNILGTLMGGGGAKGGDIVNTFAGAVSGFSGTAQVFHAGGVVGQGGVPRSAPAWLFDGAPRYHSGGWAGLAPDEVPIIAQRGERILPRGESAGGGTVVMNIQTPDAGSFRRSEAQLLARMHRGIARAQRNV